VATTPVLGTIQTSGTEPLYLGWFDYFEGIIDEVRIYPKSLSSQQIYQRYLETKDGLSNSSRIVPQETEIGDVWKSEVTPNDAFQDGLAKFSNPITIVFNNKPSADNLIIKPAAPLTTDDLVANYNYNDPDGDAESGTEIRWYKDGALQLTLNDSLTVPADQTTEGDEWYFTVRPSDGLDFGDTQISSTVVIKSNPP